MMQLIFNELSVTAPATNKHEARAWMQGVQETAARAMKCGIESLLLIPEGYLATELAPDYTVSRWLLDPDVELELRQLWQSWLSYGPFLEEIHEAECTPPTEIRCNGQAGMGIAVAWKREHAVLSAPAAPWRVDPLLVDVLNPLADQNGTAEVCNFHCPDAVRERLRWLAKRCRIKPRYVNPGHHDPASGAFRGGGSMTTPLPPDAEEVYENAIPADWQSSRSAWWGQNADGYLYRYAGQWQGGEPVVHWNGTTALSSPRAIKDNDVPAPIREAFPNRRQ